MSLFEFLSSGVVPIAVIVAVVVAIAVMALAPRPIKHRARGGLVLALMYGGITGVERLLPPQAAERGDLEAVALVCAALAVARVGFVVLIDIALERAGRSGMNQLRRDVMQTGVYILAIVLTLRALHIPVTSLLATGTVITAIVGLALQETLGNLASGASIEIEQPIGVGDWIQLDKVDAVGRVVAANWRSVTIQTDDRALFVIPNSIFSKTPFYNRSRPGGVTRRSLYFTIPSEVAPTQVHEALLEACADSADVLKDPRPSVLTWTYGDNGIQYWLRFFIADFARRDPAQSDVGTRVWYHLKRRKIDIAIPMRHTFVENVDRDARAARDADVIADRRAAIDGVDFLKALSPQARDTLAHGGHRRLFAPGETILREGDTDREFYIVRRGRVGVKSGERELGELGPGEFFGEMAMLTGSTRHATVTALVETEVFEVGEKLFKDVLKSEPHIAHEISRIVGERQAENQAKQRQSGVATAQQKVGMAEQILAKVKDLFGLD